MSVPSQALSALLALTPDSVPASEGDVTIAKPKVRGRATKPRQDPRRRRRDFRELDGVMVPIDIVAERAGVGIGTLYRHFPTKEALYEAIVVTRIDELAISTTA